jgi:hypothetical protein
MTPRTLQIIQRVLVAAVTVVLALIVITAFRQLLEPPPATTASGTTTTTSPATTTPGATTSTSTTTAPGASTTTTSGAVTPAVCSEDPPPSDGVTVLRVYFPCGSSNIAGAAFVYRAVPDTGLVLTTTLREMTNGLETGEAELGFKSPFPESAQGSFQGVSIVEGRAVVGFTNDVFPEGVDTPEGAQIFLSTLNANVFQFDNIAEIEYRLGGSCDAFWQQLGASCEIVTRAEWEARPSG